jgi:vacuolar-type H+-ATPase subunit H
MSNPTSPLAAIHQKETDLRSQLEAARKQAEVSLQAARTEAQRIVAQAEQAGRAEAQAFFEQGLQAAQQEAEVILTSAQAEAAALHDKVASRLHEAAMQIMKLVLDGRTTKGE